MSMNAALGKSVFLWNTPLVCGGIPSAIADKLLEGGFQSVILKVADGSAKHFTNLGSFVKPKWVEAVTRETVRVLQARGLKVYGYGFCYGIDVPGEAHGAISQSLALKLDGYVFDVEGKFEAKAGAPGARQLGAIFRSGLPEFPAIFCGFSMYKSFAGGTWHNVEVHKAMMAWCDAGMPMCYWAASPPIPELEASTTQWRAITTKPTFPAGRAYNGDGKIAKAEDMLAWDDRLRELGHPGESWWVLDQVVNRLDPSIWLALKSMPPFAPPPPPAPTLEERVADHERRIAALEAS